MRAPEYRAALPGDKSVTHRAWLLGLLGSGEGVVTGANRGRDCEATRAAAERLGARFRDEGDAVRVTGAEGVLRVPDAPLDLGNSGTGARLLLGVLAAAGIAATVTGDASLRSRPAERVLEPLRALGAEGSSTSGRFPVTLESRPLHGAFVDLAVPSAQVKSAVLLAALGATGETRISGAAGTRDHTERLLRAAGVALEGPDPLRLTGPARPRLLDLHVPGDPSAAAFHLTVAAVVPGARVTIPGVGLNPTRTAYLERLRNAGLPVTVDREDVPGPEPVGTLRATGAPVRLGTIEPGAVPGLIDELPALAVAAAFGEGTVRVRGATELRVKESDRLAAVAEGLAAIGARARLLDDGWEIEGSGGAPLPGGRVAARGDHRIAMAFLVAGLHTRDGVTVDGGEMIATSDPTFLENLRVLGESAA